MSSDLISTIRSALEQGQVVPYLGPEVLTLEASSAEVPATPEALVELLTAKVTVPHKIRKNLTAAAQYIENFKHRKTLVAQLKTAFATPAQPNVWHRYLAEVAPSLPLIVSAWYDDAMATALTERQGLDWGRVQGVSKSEHFGDWTHFFAASGELCEVATGNSWKTLLYQPWGAITPAANFLVSDSDFVEVLTEIDIQTPIPETVQARRSGRNFLFLGCRFRNQLERTFARQIIKRSTNQHWAVLPGELTRNELRFLEEQNITRIDSDLSTFVDEFIGTGGTPLRTAVG